MRFPTWVRRFDRAADDALEHVRGNPTIDFTMNAVTNAAEFSAIWHTVGLVRGVARGRLDQSLALSAALGVESLIVNQGLKRVFNRRRPTTAGDDRYDIRAPITSSFPSGHASSATFAAIILIGWDGKRWAPAWVPLAGAVALSRPYVRIHHMSDIIGGVAAGTLLGIIAKRALRSRG